MFKADELLYYLKEAKHYLWPVVGFMFLVTISFTIGLLTGCGAIILSIVIFMIAQQILNTWNKKRFQKIADIRERMNSKSLKVSAFTRYVNVNGFVDGESKDSLDLWSARLQTIIKYNKTTKVISIIGPKEFVPEEMRALAPEYFALRSLENAHEESIVLYYAERDIKNFNFNMIPFHMYRAFGFLCMLITCILLNIHGLDFEWVLCILIIYILIDKV